MLFRFSALTYNRHRIHYDQPYATGVEGYPGLVVHGPLLALLLLELPRASLRSGGSPRFDTGCGGPRSAASPSWRTVPNRASWWPACRRSARRVTGIVRFR